MHIDIETKINVGDKVFVMLNNHIYPAQVESVSCSVLTNKESQFVTQIIYDVKLIFSDGKFDSNTIQVSESRVALSLDEFVKDSEEYYC